MEKTTVNVVRRVVTGHDAEGQSIFLSDGPTPSVFANVGLPGLVFNELWESASVPAKIRPTEKEPSDHALLLAPPRGGVRIRINDIPAEGANTSKENAIKVFESLGASGSHVDESAHAFMHKTETVDFAIILEGEIVLFLDKGETLLKTGDVVIQRGTSHAWANRSGKNCRVAFILIDGQFEGSLGNDAH